MPNPYRNNFQTPSVQYDPRWFIWTIVFLVVAGVGLTAFITLSQEEDAFPLPKHITKNQ